MSDDEDYSSEDDEDYVPSEGEAVSEEENSGDEEDLNLLKEDQDANEVGSRRKKVKKKAECLPSRQENVACTLPMCNTDEDIHTEIKLMQKRWKKKKNIPYLEYIVRESLRKRHGGIKLEGEDVSEDQDNSIKEENEAKKILEEEIKKEKEAKKEEMAKKRADDLWSSFLSDVGTRPSARPSTSSSVSSPLKPVTPVQKSTATPKVTDSKEQTGKVTITKVFDFAGEAVKVSKEVDANSKEAKEALKEKPASGETTTSPAPSAKPAGLSGLSGGTKRPGGGLSGLLDKINKKPKMSTLEKSKLDWNSFKEKEGISDELNIHHRGKESFLERKAFLERADYRQFELEKNLRLGTSKR